MWRYRKLVKLLFFVEPNTKVNAKYYCNVLSKKMISKMKTQVKHIGYSFTQDGARAHIAKLTLEMLKEKKQLQLMESHHWLTNSLGLNPVDFGI